MKKQIVINAFTLVLLLLVSPLWAAPMLSIDSATGIKGEIVTVGVNYIADSPAISGGNPVAVRFRINFSPSLAEAGTALAGLSLAGDHVQFSKVDNTAGTVDVIIVPPAKKIALSTGQILQIPFRLKNTAVSSVGEDVQSALTFSLLKMSNDSTAIALGTPSNGTLTLKGLHNNTGAANDQLSDAFNTAVLDETRWLPLLPSGGSITLTGSQLALHVAADDHYFGSSNDTVRVMQAIVDENFSMQVKFDSLPTQQYQMQGILVEETASGASLRFEVYSDGSQLQLHVASFRDGQSKSLYSAPFQGLASTPLYLRVERVAQQWRMATSSDGETWQIATRFLHDQIANEVGVYVGNKGSKDSIAPAFTALVDDITIYAASTPAPRPPDTVDPVISQATASVQVGAEGDLELIVRWATDELTTGRVLVMSSAGQHIDPDDFPFAQTVFSDPRAVEHSVTLTKLYEGNRYYIHVTAVDGSGNSVTESLSIVFEIPRPNSALSDDFSATVLDATQWLYLNPLGGSMSLAHGQLVLDVPAGEHYFGASNNTVRVMQPIINEDFTMAVKFDSLPTQKYQVQGILVEGMIPENNGMTATALRFEIYSDGHQLYLQAGDYANAKTHLEYNQPLTLPESHKVSGPVYLRVARAGHQWTFSTSIDGVVWQLADSFERLGLLVNEVGVYAGNTGNKPPAYTALIDEITVYAASTPAQRIPLPPDTTAPVISDVSTRVQAGENDSVDVVVSWRTDEPTTGVIRYDSTSVPIPDTRIEQTGIEHSVILKGLTQGNNYYYFNVLAVDVSGNHSKVDFSLLPRIPRPNSALSDTFNATTLDATQWLYLDPLGGGSLDPTGSQLVLDVPAGEHYFRASNDTVRLMQPIVDEDFVMEVKFDSLPTQKYQVQGILVEQDSQTSLRFEIYSDGSQLYLQAGHYANAKTNLKYHQPLTLPESHKVSGPVYLRVARVGQQWTFSTSVDGVVWQLADSFANPLMANEVGVYAGNTGSAPPAYTALIDDITIYAASTPPTRTPPPLDTTPPVISDVVSVVRADGAGGAEVIVRWITDEPTTGRVAYGSILAPKQGAVATDQRATEHSVTLSGLQADAFYLSQVVATDSSGNMSSEKLGITTTVPVANDRLSDDFNATALDATQWLYLDPLGGGSLDPMGSQLVLDVSAGEHYFGSSNDTVRVMQPIVDEDFVMEVKFDSLPTQKYQVQGILVEQDSQTSLRFEIYSDGSQRYLLAGDYANAKTELLYNEPLVGSTPLYLRVERVGQQWTFSTSVDGKRWQLADSFKHELVVNEVGVYAGNTGSEPPAYTALIDDITVYAASTPIARTPTATTLNAPAPAPIPVITQVSSRVQTVSGRVEVVLSWSTDEPTVGTVVYGDSPAYEVGYVAIEQSTTEHSVTLTGLLEDTLYHYQVTATNNQGGSSSTEDLSVTTVIPVANDALSDDLNGAALDGNRWLYVNPLGDGLMNLTGSQLALYVPSGEHYFGSSNDTVRIMQRMVDEDFAMEVKFDSFPTQKYQAQGILVEQNPDTALRFEIYSDGKQLKLYAGNYHNGSSETEYNAPLALSTPIYLRVERVAQQWTVSTSADGITWQVAAGFAHALAVSEVGVYAGNAGDTPPAYTALIDDITLYAASTPVPDTVAPTLSNIKSTVFGTWIELTWHTDKLAFGAAQYGETLAYDLGVTESGNGAFYSHRVVLGPLDSNTAYNVQIMATDRSGNTTSADNQVVTTGEVLADGPVIDVWQGTSQTFGALGTPQNWVNILGNVRALNGVESLTYSLNGAPEKPLTVGPNDTRLASNGDFNVDIATSDLAEGMNTVMVTSTDTSGYESSTSIIVDYQSGKVWPNSYTVDWASTAAISEVATVVDGRWQLEGDSVRTVEPGYDRLIAIGDVTWENYEVTVPITVYGLAADGYDYPSNGPGIGLGMRWPGHIVVDDTQPSIGWHTLGAIGWYRWHYNSGERLMLSGAAGRNNRSRSFSFELGETYMFKMRVQTIPGQGGRYMLKVWEMGQDEPTGWDLTLQESLADPQLGSLLLIAHEVDARFGNVTIVPINE